LVTATILVAASVPHGTHSGCNVANAKTGLATCFAVESYRLDMMPSLKRVANVWLVAFALWSVL
jgi:hypothetical protein